MKKITIDKWADDIKNSIVNDVKDIAEYHSRPNKTKEGGFFSIPRQVFCYIDYLGKITYGISRSTERSVKFIKDYFSPNYNDYADLLYGMWRHGTVHEYKPKTLCGEFHGQGPKKIKVKWSANNDGSNHNRQYHLGIFSMIGKRATVYININSCQLVDDLISAFEKLITELKNNRNFWRDCKKRLEAEEIAKEVTPTINIKAKKTQAKSISDPVYGQILLAWNNRQNDKVLNQNGDVIRKNTSHNNRVNADC